MPCPACISWLREAQLLAQVPASDCPLYIGVPFAIYTRLHCCLLQQLYVIHQQLPQANRHAGQESSQNVLCHTLWCREHSDSSVAGFAMSVALSCVRVCVPVPIRLLAVYQQFIGNVDTTPTGL